MIVARQIVKEGEVMMKPFLAFIAVLVFSVSMACPAFPHCEIPCGIYDDEMRIAMIAEHITTIEKSINQIGQLSKEEPRNLNQIVRWVQNKENHANELQHIVTQYFMTQRLKPVDKDEKEAYVNFAKLLVLDAIRPGKAVTRKLASRNGKYPEVT